MKHAIRRALAVLSACLCLLQTASAALAEGGEVYPKETASDEGSPPGVYISEVMSANKCTVALADGSFPDWLELHNPGDSAVDLAGWTLRCGKDSWTIPALRLEAGEYRVLWCDKSGEEGHAPFAVDKAGEALSLLMPDGATADAFDLPALGDDRSFCRGGGESGESLWPTPGFENSEAGYAAFQSERLPPERDLAIGEVMVYNAWYLPQTVGYEEEYYDWVEITNLSDRTLNLKNYFLSDKGKMRLLFRLPDQVLRAGESAVVFCSEERGGGEIAPFDLSSGGETLYLSRKDGALCDYVCLRDIPLGSSVGRTPGEGGFFYYAEPSPGEKNRGGVRFTGAKPEALTPDGVYEDVKALKVELLADGLIRYTLDGSLPTEDSALYTGPITLKKTAVIRAVSYQEDHLPSEPVNLSYILNEGHSLPVVSLVCPPEDLFDAAAGIYANPAQRWEKAGAVMLYDGDERLSIACGVKLHGATSRLEQSKKSFKLSFRDRYDGRLEHDLFQNGVAEFKSILLRADQESEESTQMRDVLMHTLAREAFPELPVQDHRYAVLYLNGEYWGVYTLREAHSEAHFAAHYGYEEDSVSQWKASWPSSSLPEKVYQFALQNSLSDENNYAYVAEHVDVESVIGWCVMQVYSGNFDFNSPNMRFYYSPEDELLHYALVDLDLGMYSYGDFAQLFGFGYAYTTLAAQLMNSGEFRSELLSRLAEALDGPLADEHVLSVIDSLAAELEPEIAHDHARWGGSLSSWQGMVEKLRAYIRQNNGRAGNVLELLQLSRFVSFDEIKAYFPDATYLRGGE